MTDILPDNVVKLTTLIINRDKHKNCDCYEHWYIDRKWPSYEIDTTNREVTCRHCGAIVDPFEALLTISEKHDRCMQELTDLFNQAKELSEYKPWLLVIRELERECRSGKMVLSCPHCNKGILFEEMTCWINKERELERRKFKEKPTQTKEQGQRDLVQG
jgi:hypothetical protein